MCDSLLTARRRDMKSWYGIKAMMTEPEPPPNWRLSEMHPKFSSRLSREYLSVIVFARSS